MSRVDFSGSLVDGWFLPDPKIRKSDIEFNVEKLFVTPQDKAAIQHGCYFDEAAAKRVLRFFEKYLKHSKGRWAGKPFKLLDWQRYDILSPLFGWKKPDGTRRFRIAYIEIPKKNGKSTLSSGIALYLLMADGERGAEVYTAAADRDQAKIVFKESEKMVRASKPLSRRLKIVPSKNTIVHYASGSVYRALSADVPTKEGLNISGLIFDELHAQKTRDLWDTLRYGGAAREQPLIISITTAGFDRHSICWEQHEYARKILKGVVNDDAFFAYIASTNWEDAEARVSDVVEIDWRTPEAWYMANPSLGHTIKEADFAQECKEAQESPAKQNTFKRYRLNIWTRAETRWFSPEKWNACGGNLPTDLAERHCWGGLDLSSTTDLSSFSLVFEADKEGFVPVLSWSWCPDENLMDRVRRDKVPYDLWAEQGFLFPTPGNVIDYDFIFHKILEIKGLYPHLQIIGFDRYSATQLMIQIEENGIDTIPIRQSMTGMSAPSKELERLVVGGRLVHAGNPVLTWAADNVVAISDASENIRPSKEKSTERIDPIVSLVIAIGARDSVKPEEANVYQERGLVIL